MLVKDIEVEIKKTGNFLTLAGIADTHFLIDSNDPEAYQPLDPEAYGYMKYCFEELRSCPQFYGKIVTYTAGDLTELERSSVRKLLRAIRKNDTRAQDTIHKRVLGDYVLPRLKALTQKTQYLGGVAGNHMIEFCNQADGYGNSEAYLIRRLGGTYFGEGKLLLNIRVIQGKSSRLLRCIIVHGSKAGTKASVINELQRMYAEYGKIDLLVKAHAHDPTTTFCARYDLPDKEGQKMKKTETLVMCLGSTRDGEKIGYDDYSERGNYPPCASRYPMAVFHAYRPALNNHNLEIKIRPWIM